MRHPFRRYSFFLAEKLGKSLGEILALNGKEISEWMAYDLTNDEDWIKKYNTERELERQRSLSNQERARLFKQLLGGKNG